MVCIVDYEMGNLRSVQKAFQVLGRDVRITDDPRNVRSADRLVVPGVGAFPDAMNNLKQRGLDDAIRDFTAKGRPLLGVCLGMQLFFDRSDEYGDHEGLGLIPGQVVRYPESMTVGDEPLKIPHMGWNTLEVPAHSPFRAVDGEYVYFVHSHYAIPDRPVDIAAETEYGVRFCSMAARDNVWAAQFHPEKSGAVGFKLLEAFLKRT